jgi:predicted 2-oxoglutarate/Fe(II)-dependent dioxygenase YbiX
MKNNLCTFEKIYYYQDILKNSLELIDLIEKTDSECTKFTGIPSWKPWISPDGTYQFGLNKIINTGIKYEKNKKLLEIYNSINNVMEYTAHHYAKENNIKLKKVANLNIGKYPKGKGMQSHADSHGDPGSPSISSVLYLNDDYEGGELYFKEQNITLKPSKGSVIVFPSIEPYYHESIEITEGIKYICLGFWYKDES